MNAARCPWCGEDPLYIQYHDHEWGVPSHDERHLFEMLILEGAQAGLSWITVLRKRDNYRRVFHDFDHAKLAKFTQADIDRCLRDPGIVRNRLKVQSVVINARATLEIDKEFGGLDPFLWRFVDGKPIQNRLRSMADAVASTPESDAMSRALKERGFKFVGTTICYAFMQAVGMVNDHLVSCPRWKKLGGR